MPDKKQINLKEVGIRLTQNPQVPRKLVPYFVFGIDRHKINDFFSDCTAYNTFVTSKAWKAMHSKVMLLRVSSNTCEFCSNSSELQNSGDILRELHQVFASPVLDKFIETLNQQALDSSLVEAFSASSVTPQSSLSLG